MRFRGSVKIIYETELRSWNQKMCYKYTHTHATTNF